MNSSTLPRAYYSNAVTGSDVRISFFPAKEASTPWNVSIRWKTTGSLSTF